MVTIFTVDEIYYLAIPPNRYIFYGAELDYFESDSDDESESESSTQTSEQVPETSVNITSKEEKTTPDGVQKGSCDGELSKENLDTIDVVSPQETIESHPRNVDYHSIENERESGDTIGCTTGVP